MQICKLIPLLILLQLILIVSKIESSPIVPILTALATSAAGLFQIQVDTLHIAKYLRDAAHHKRNRGAFVRDLLYTAFYRSGQSYNVIVFNLAEEHRQRLHGVIFYGSVSFTDHTRFGVWVFEYGMFENQGARGWHNWGMIGSFKKSKDGNTIYFHRRHPHPPIHVTNSDSNNSTESSITSASTSSSSTTPSINVTTISIPITTTIDPIKLKQLALEEAFGLQNKFNSMEMVPINNEHQSKFKHQDGDDDDNSYHHQDKNREKMKKHKITIKIEDNRKNNKKKKTKKVEHLDEEHSI